MFVPNAIFAIFRMSITGYKPYVRSQHVFCCISYINQWLQTVCSFPIRFLRYFACKCLFPIWFLQYFACKSVVTNPMVVHNAMSVEFQMYSTGYKAYVRSQYDFCGISYIRLRLQTLRSFSVRFLQFFVHKSDIPNLAFLFSALSSCFCIWI